MKKSKLSIVLAVMLMLCLMAPAVASAATVDMAYGGGSIYLRTGPGREYGTNGTVTIEAGSTYKFIVANYGGKTMTIANSAGCTVTAGTYTLPADTINGNNREQFIPGPNEGWDEFVLTIANTTDQAVEIVLTIQ